MPSLIEGALQAGGKCAAAAALAGLLSGCANIAPLPALPDIAEALSLDDDAVVGSPTEVYSRLARGAMACWFGSDGPLKAAYVYHAEAQPAGKGGKAEIVIHERDANSDNPKGLRAFRVQITPKGETANVAVENLKLEPALAASMDADVRRWAGGAIGCAAPDGEWVPDDKHSPDALTGKDRRT